MGQLIRCSRKVREQVHKDYTVFPENMPLPELRQAAVKRKQALFPVMSIKTNKMIGVLSKTDLVDPPRTRVALVDHNEFSQAVKGVGGSGNRGGDGPPPPGHPAFHTGPDPLPE